VLLFGVGVAARCASGCSVVQVRCDAFVGCDVVAVAVTSARDVGRFGADLVRAPTLLPASDGRLSV
jgi:Ni,Fe-hydrogenase III small subunit